MLLRVGSIKQMTEKETCCPESKLDLLNLMLSCLYSEMYWKGLRSLNVEGEGDFTN